MDIFPLVSAAAAVAETTVKRGALDSILNVLIPIAVFVMFGFMVYKQFGHEIDRLIAWIKKQMADDKLQQQVPINNPYMSDGVIEYR